MAALRSRCGHYIFTLWFLLSSIFFYFLAYSQPSQIGCLPYFYTWCDLSANLECRSETSCRQLAGNARPKKSLNNRHLGTIAQICRAISSQLRHGTYQQSEKNLLSSNRPISPIYPYDIVNFGLLAAEIVS